MGVFVEIQVCVAGGESRPQPNALQKKSGSCLLYIKAQLFSAFQVKMKINGR